MSIESISDNSVIPLDGLANADGDSTQRGSFEPVRSVLPLENLFSGAVQANGRVIDIPQQTNGADSRPLDQMVDSICQCMPIDVPDRTGNISAPQDSLSHTERDGLRY